MIDNVFGLYKAWNVFLTLANQYWMSCPLSTFKSLLPPLNLKGNIISLWQLRTKQVEIAVVRAWSITLICCSFEWAIISTFIHLYLLLILLLIWMVSMIMFLMMVVILTLVLKFLCCIKKLNMAMFSYSVSFIGDWMQLH